MSAIFIGGEPMIKLEVSTHSGDTDIIEVEEYDVDEITSKRNDSTLESIAIGIHSYSRIDLKNIKVLED